MALAKACLALIISILVVFSCPFDAAAEEFGVGVLGHDVRLGVSAPPREGGLYDVSFVYRSSPLTSLSRWVPQRLYGSLEVNTAGRSSFAAVGGEWRKSLGDGRIHVAANLGLGAVDGCPYRVGRREYKVEGDPWKPLGSYVLFNPGLSLGLNVRPNVSIETTWQHYSHAHLLGHANPGIDNVGLRLIWRYGR